MDPQNRWLNVEVVLEIRTASIPTDGLLYRNLWTD